MTLESNMFRLFTATLQHTPGEGVCLKHDLRHGQMFWIHMYVSLTRHATVSWKRVGGELPWSNGSMLGCQPPGLGFEPGCWYLESVSPLHLLSLGFSLACFIRSRYKSGLKISIFISFQFGYKSGLKLNIFHFISVWKQKKNMFVGVLREWWNIFFIKIIPAIG